MLCKGSGMKLVLTLILSLIVTGYGVRPAKAQEITVFVPKGPIVVDVMAGLNWMRCSIGQVWENGKCDGTPILVPFAVTETIIARTTSSMGDGWRLPTRDELQRLVVDQTNPPMINQDIFSETHPGIYWSADQNWLLPNNFWVVNFFTGHNYGRARRNQNFAVRLVQER
ncbi:putative DUF1566 family protein (plasmid) [Octadecabacter arcticus 238]|jgi:hypothetical protein|uniref:Putative DUF1566 family protein n=1 Tax=Octadecabacter arcticus 238 TaxID=391616 RepID=M9RSK4_9RHOB|nr:putative DUF1566 family protein [Octadecabacter arcticus 238]